MKRRTFDNGFRVIHQKSHIGLKSASIQVICDVGSIHEAEDFRGAVPEALPSTFLAALPSYCIALLES